MIAHLKDQLQETRAKTSMERKYIEKECQVQVKFYQHFFLLNQLKINGANFPFLTFLDHF